jgi:hypothetical protein
MNWTSKALVRFAAHSTGDPANIVCSVVSDWWAQISGVASAFAGLGERRPLQSIFHAN